MSGRPLKIANSKLKELVRQYYHDELKEDAHGLRIRCPWHKPDNNPSCVVFFGSAVFYCPVCHASEPKGRRGVRPYEAFQALGMTENRAKELFLGEPTLDASADSFELSSIPEPLTVDHLERRGSLPQSTLYNKEDQRVVNRVTWPNHWGFRDLTYNTMNSQWFHDRFAPTKVLLRKERLPRLALKIGGAQKCQEVYLRLSSAVQPKAINSVGLTFNEQSKYFASLFGLVNNRLCANSRGIILVEGPYDALHLLQHVYRPEIGGRFDVVALLGTPQWLYVHEQLKPICDTVRVPIILAFDNDLAGRKLTQAALKDLRRTDCCVKNLDYPLAIKDPGELPFDAFVTCLNRLGLI